MKTKQIAHNNALFDKLLDESIDINSLVGYLIWTDHTGAGDPVSYWDLSECQSVSNPIEGQPTYLLHESVQGHLQSDVSIRPFFYGGLDSTMLLSIIK